MAPEIWSGIGDNPRPTRLISGAQKILTEKNLAGYRRAQQETGGLEAALSPATPRRAEPNRTSSGRAAAGRLAAPLLTIRALQATASQRAHPELMLVATRYKTRSGGEK